MTPDDHIRLKDRRENTTCASHSERSIYTNELLYQSFPHRSIRNTSTKAPITMAASNWAKQVLILFAVACTSMLKVRSACSRLQRTYVQFKFAISTLFRLAFTCTCTYMYTRHIYMCIFLLIEQFLNFHAINTNMLLSQMYIFVLNFLGCLKPRTRHL